MPAETSTPEVPQNPKQVLADITIEMQTAMSGCLVSPTPLEDGGQEIHVRANLLGRPSFGSLKETSAGDELPRQYEYSEETNPGVLRYLTWVEGGSTITESIGLAQTPQARAATREFEPAKEDASDLRFRISRVAGAYTRDHPNGDRAPGQSQTRRQRARGPLGQLASRLVSR